MSSLASGVRRERRERRRERSPGPRVAALAALLVLSLPLALAAHAVVHPGRGEPGAYQRYVLRVPNERDIPTTRVELELPEGVRVVSFAEVPGWSLTATRDAEGRVDRAVWTGSLPVGRFVDLPFIAVNPQEEGRLTWRAFQTYADGERVPWTGPEDSQTPASFTEIRGTGAAPAGGGPAALLLAGVALLLALLALGLVLRENRP